MSPRKHIEATNLHPLVSTCKAGKGNRAISPTHHAGRRQSWVYHGDDAPKPLSQKSTALWRSMAKRVSWNGGTPLNHPFSWDFPNQPFWSILGIPIYRNHHISLPNTLLNTSNILQTPERAMAVDTGSDHAWAALKFSPRPRLPKKGCLQFVKLYPPRKTHWVVRMFKLHDSAPRSLHVEEPPI